MLDFKRQLNVCGVFGKMQPELRVVSSLTEQCSCLLCFSSLLLVQVESLKVFVNLQIEKVIS